MRTFVITVCLVAVLILWRGCRGPKADDVFSKYFLKAAPQGLIVLEAETYPSSVYVGIDRGIVAFFDFQGDPTAYENLCDTSNWQAFIELPPQYRIHLRDGGPEWLNDRIDAAKFVVVTPDRVRGVCVREDGFSFFNLTVESNILGARPLPASDTTSSAPRG